jgi:cytosine/adenosine deaminase-related metal-dependent hydrolase
MKALLIRANYLICRVTDDSWLELIEGGATYQHDGKIVEIGAYTATKTRQSKAR